MGTVASTSTSLSSPTLRFEWLIEGFSDLAAVDDIPPELNNAHEDE